MKESLPEMPECCAATIFELSGVKFEPEAASGLWSEIQQHKWLLSEKVGRDVGLRTACIDFIENTELAHQEYLNHTQRSLLQEMGARVIGREVWESISDTQPPKQLVQRRIILPLTEDGLSAKHGVVPPKAIMFFGPPGTGKTHFAKAIAGVLSWLYVEIVPSMLMVDGADKAGANLRVVMEKARSLDEAVLFIDEFEEIASSRDGGDRIEKSITNEFLKQIPLVKGSQKRILLVCATNYIRQLDAAMLRPGRFDCIIPVGGLDADGRKTILSHFLSKLNAGDVDMERLIEMTSKFTPADIEYLFQQVAQFAFEQELESGRDYQVTTETFALIMPKIKPSLAEEIVAEFERDCCAYSRV
jgi:transitional endoplasmic reticulum ATPase